MDDLESASIREVYSDFANNGSIQGLAHHLRRYYYVKKKGWLTLFLVSFGALLYYEALFIYEVFIDQPTSTSITFERSDFFEFPDIILCDTNAEYDLLWETVTKYEPDTPGSRAVDYVHFIAAMSENPLMTDLVRGMRENMSQAIARYPGLEDLYNKKLKVRSPVWAALYQTYGTFEQSLAFRKGLYDEGVVDFTSGNREEVREYHMKNISEGRMEDKFVAAIIREGTKLIQNRTVVFCIWNERNCSQADNWEVIGSDTGLCDKLTIPGRVVMHARQSIRMIIDLRVDEANWTNNPSVMMYLAFSNHKKGIRRFMSGVDKFIALAPGVSVDIKIGQIEYSDISGKTDCVVDPTYAKRECMYDCAGRKQQQGCKNCKSPLFWNSVPDFEAGVRVCGIYDMLFCDHETSRLIEQCIEECNGECAYTSYLVSSSTAKFQKTDQRHHRKLLNGGADMTLEYMQRNLLEITIGIRGMDIQKIEVKLQYGPMDILAGIGGMFGLFIGASVLSVYEVVELFGEFSRASYFRLKNRPNRVCEK